MATKNREAPQGRKRSEDQQLKRKSESLKDETQHGITVVVLFTLAAILLLSLFDLAGPLGNEIDRALMLLFGGLRYLVPIVLIVFGYILLFPQRYSLRASAYYGLALFLLSSTALLHLTIPTSDAVSTIDDGRGGGYVGLLFSAPLRNLAGTLASTVILIGMLIISLLVMFNTTLESLASRGNVFGEWYSIVRSWWYRLRYRLEKHEEQTDDERVDVVPTKPEPTNGIEAPEPKFSTRPVDGAVLEPTTIGQTRMFPSSVTKRHHRKVEIPFDLLERSSSKPSLSHIEEKKEQIRKTLENFGIAVEMGDVNIGPTVTQFTLKPAEGVKLSQITTLNNDLALALAAHPIRIEAPIPGQSLVGIEVPNEAVAVVNLREILESEAFKKRKSSLTFSLGKDVAGKPWVANLDPMPHLLIAGATGSGKSVMINSLIVSLLYANSPDDLKFILIDPKRVEFSLYNSAPHLLTPVITDTKKTVNALRWIVGEMDRRFQMLSESGKRNIQAYHQEVDDGMPYIIVVIDELADLMSVAAQEVEGAIIRLAQMARAVGIHLVVATQRPSVNVITGLIKANITARIAFNVASSVDSRTILDFSGAEKLLGKGDMLFVSSDLSKPVRLQGAYVTDKETQRIVEYLRQSAGDPEYVSDVAEKPVAEGGTSGEVDEFGDDELLPEAKELILRSGKASASFLQRRLRIGYARAARILDLLEERGIIGPGEGAKPREILISREGYAGTDASEGWNEGDAGTEEPPADDAQEEEQRDVR